MGIAVHPPVAALVLVCLRNSVGRGHGGKGNKDFDNVGGMHFVKFREDLIRSDEFYLLGRDMVYDIFESELESWLCSGYYGKYRALYM